MSILTGLIIIVAMVVLAQKTESILDFAFRERAPKIAPQNDVAAVFAGESRIIDVLANDENAVPEDGERLSIVVSPSCGAAEPTTGGILYISTDRCVGPQLFAYCVSRGDECPTASVTVTVAAAPADGAPRPSGGDLIASRGAGEESPASRDPALTGATSDDTADAPPARTPPPASEQPAPVIAETAPDARTAAPTASLRGRAGDQTLDVDVARAGEAPTTLAAATPQAPPAPDRGAGLDGALSGDDANPPRIGATRSPGAPSGDGGVSAPGQAVIAAIQPIAPAPRPQDASAPQLNAAPRIDDGAVTAPPEGDATQAEILAALTDDADQPEWTPGARPDVSAIETEPSPPEAPPTEVAALTPEADEGTLEQARDAAVEDIRAAAAAAAASCPATVESTAAAGGSSLVTVTSDCRAGDAFELEHGDLRFGATFDGAGIARVTLPVMDDKAGVVARFASGDTVAAELNVNWRELAKTQRIAVAWTDLVDLNLHAFEYAADFGEEGHVWQDRPRGFRLVRRTGGGYLDSFPAVTAEGQSIEVYTFWISRRSPRGVARIALDYASRGDLPEGAFCADGPLASPGYTVVRSTGGVAEAPSRGRFAPAPCGQALDQSVRYAAGALPDLEIE